MKAVVFAYHDVGCMGVRVLLDLGIGIGAVYTHADDPAENRWYGSVADACRGLELPCHVGVDPHAPAEIERIRRLRPDAIFSLYYRDMLRDSVLSLAKNGAVNLHGSYLPRYRGRAPVNWMILHGETRGGVTLHHMAKKADAGDVVDQEAFEIGPDDTAVDVYAKMLPAAERVLRRSAVAVVRGVAPRAMQMETKATYHGRRRPQDGRIEWRWCAQDVRNLVRAVTKPYPGAFTFAGSKKVVVWWAEDGGMLLDETGPRPYAPGEVSRLDGGVFVHCGDNHAEVLRLTRVEIDGREGDALEFADILRDGIQLGGS